MVNKAVKGHTWVRANAKIEGALLNYVVVMQQREKDTTQHVRSRGAKLIIC